MGLIDWLLFGGTAEAKERDQERQLRAAGKGPAELAPGIREDVAYYRRKESERQARRTREAARATWLDIFD